VKLDVDPDRATVYGAARIGGAAGGYSVDGKLLPPAPLQVDEVVAKDLSVVAVDGRSGGESAVVLVAANTRLPAKGESRFDLMDPSRQTEAQIVIVEAKHGAPPHECRELDRFQISGLPPAPGAITDRIAIRFEVNRRGIVEVTAYDAVSGKEFKRTVKVA
jgi:molecular chaperone DnaK (HSP70)